MTGNGCRLLQCGYYAGGISTTALYDHYPNELDELEVDWYRVAYCVDAGVLLQGTAPKREKKWATPRDWTAKQSLFLFNLITFYSRSIIVSH